MQRIYLFTDFFLDLFQAVKETFPEKSHVYSYFSEGPENKRYQRKHNQAFLYGCYAEYFMRKRNELHTSCQIELPEPCARTNVFGELEIRHKCYCRQVQRYERGTVCKSAETCGDMAVLFYAHATNWGKEGEKSPCAQQLLWICREYLPEYESESSLLVLLFKGLSKSANIWRRE